jgi:hypothetical protein
VKEQTIKTLAWANQKTKMLATYSHLCDADVDKELSAIYGITDVNASESHAMNPQQCAHCGKVNSPTANFCEICGLPLTPEATVTTEQLAVEIQNTTLYKQIMEDIEKKILGVAVGTV